MSGAAPWPAVGAGLFCGVCCGAGSVAACPRVGAGFLLVLSRDVFFSVDVDLVDVAGEDVAPWSPFPPSFPQAASPRARAAAKTTLPTRLNLRLCSVVM